MPESTASVRGLVEELARERHHLRALASAAISESDATRLRTSVTLHESVAQVLVAVSWQLAALARQVHGAGVARRLLDLRALNDAALADITALAESLHPRVLEDLGLAAALGALARRIEASTPIRVVRDVDPTVAVGLSAEASAALYRVAEEALHNAAQHSAALAVSLSLVNANGRCTLEVIDDGRGFDVAEAERGHRPGRGIFAMRERLQLVGGVLEISSATGAGTKLSAYIESPVQTSRSHA